MTNSNDANTVAQATLLFEIENPNYDELWLEGYEDGLASNQEEANPYPEDSTAYHYWSEGWWAAFYGEEPLFDYQGHVVGSTETPSAQTDLTPTKQPRLRTLGQILSGVLVSSAVAAVTMDFLL